MSKYICFHTSPASRNTLIANMCTADSMEPGNGGLPGIYCMSIDEKYFNKDKAMYTNFIANREKLYGKFMHQFVIDTKRPHFSMFKLTITKDILIKMNNSAKFTNDIDAVWYDLVEWKKVRNDAEFLRRLITSTHIRDVKFWVKCISSVADFIIEDDPKSDIPADGVIFVDVRPEKIITL